MNNSSGKKIPSGITKEPEQPIDLKAIWEKVKKKKKEKELNWIVDDLIPATKLFVFDTGNKAEEKK